MDDLDTECQMLVLKEEIRSLEALLFIERKFCDGFREDIKALEIELDLKVDEIVSLSAELESAQVWARTLERMVDPENE